MFKIGIDVGGTFTDFVVGRASEAPRYFKTHSTPPYGLWGGKPGKPHIYRLFSHGQERLLRSKEVSVRVQPGDRIFCLSAGGGGFGDPQDRPPDKRAWDVKNGYCSSAEQA